MVRTNEGQIAEYFVKKYTYQSILSKNSYVPNPTHFQQSGYAYFSICEL